MVQRSAAVRAPTAASVRDAAADGFEKEGLSGKYDGNLPCRGAAVHVGGADCLFFSAATVPCKRPQAATRHHEIAPFDLFYVVGSGLHATIAPTDVTSTFSPGGSFAPLTTSNFFCNFMFVERHP